MKEVRNKELYAIEVLLGEDSFVAALRSLGRYDLIPTKIYYRTSKS